MTLYRSVPSTDSNKTADDYDDAFPNPAYSPYAEIKDEEIQKDHYEKCSNVDNLQDGHPYEGLPRGHPS